MKIPAWWWFLFAAFCALYLASVVVARIGASSIHQQAGDIYDRVAAIPDQQMTAQDGEELNLSKRMLVLGLMAEIWLFPSILFFLFIAISIAVAARRSSHCAPGLAASAASETKTE